jgi:hypothetical protein
MFLVFYLIHEEKEKCGDLLK